MQQAAVVAESQEVKRKHQELSDFFDRVDLLSDLWTYRTRPRLGVLKAIHTKVMVTKWESVEETKGFLDFVDGELEHQALQLDDLVYWIADERLSDVACKMVGQELERCAESIQSREPKSIMNFAEGFMIVNFYGVRVVGCKGLPTLSVFVRVRFGDGDWLRTVSVEGSTEPQWQYAGAQSEFHVNSPGDDGGQLEVEVMCDGKFGRQPFSMGNLLVDFAGRESGLWQSVTGNLQEIDGGEIEVEVYYGSRTRQLIGVMPPPPPTPDLAPVSAQPMGPAATPSGISLVRKREQEPDPKQMGATRSKAPVAASVAEGQEAPLSPEESAS
jgi:hypothetical protein